MAIPILHFWEKYFYNHDEGLGSTYERFIINKVLYDILAKYDIKSVLETPAFGFTGLSGINSLGIALKGVSVTVIEENPTRLELMQKIWSLYDVDISFDMPAGRKYDMSWNFSALWFVDDLQSFLSQLSDITNKVILIMVPNRTGLGYLHQKFTGKNDLKALLKEENICPQVFVPMLKKLGWNMIQTSYIDCPLWPDIGMSKEDFLRKLKLSFLIKQRQKNNHCLTILDYYSGKDPDMKDRLGKLDAFERFAPNLFKKIWAHHRYFLFVSM